MTTKIKTTLLTGLFFFALLTGLQAQDKYDYATVEYIVAPTKNVIHVSINGTTFKEVEVNKKDYEGGKGDNLNPLLKQVSEMNIDGWEVYSTNGQPGTTDALKVWVLYHLRKKK